MPVEDNFVAVFAECLKQFNTRTSLRRYWNQSNISIPDEHRDGCAELLNAALKATPQVAEEHEYFWSEKHGFALFAPDTLPHHRSDLSHVGNNEFHVAGTTKFLCPMCGGDTIKLLYADSCTAVAQCQNCKTESVACSG